MVPILDPIGTVRIHPDDDPMDAASRRNIKVAVTKYEPYHGSGWVEFTFPSGTLAGGGNTLTNAEQPLSWPVQPWWQLAAVLELPIGQEDAQALAERRAEVREDWRSIVAGTLLHHGCRCSADIDGALADEITKTIMLVKRERDQALAHDRQPYPTAWSYEKLSEVHNELVEGLKHQLEPLVGKEAFADHPGHQGLLEILGHVLTEAKLGHKMSEMLLERNYQRGPQGLADFFSEVESAQTKWLDRERALLSAPSQPWTIQVPDELEEAMRTGIRAWFDVESLITSSLTPTGRDDVARGAAGAAYAVLEAADLVLAPRLRSGPLVRFAVGVPPDMYISDLYARFRAAGFELRLTAEPKENRSGDA